MMELSKILSMVDHTLLKPESTWAQIQEICDDAIKYGTATVCIPASYVARCRAYMDAKASKVGVCTVIGFPTGYVTTAAKVFETSDAIKNGADEIDMVMNIGILKESFFRSIFPTPSSFVMRVTTKTAPSICDTTVAIATANTFCGKTMHRITFKTMFTTPQISI
jgi:deoxyribose-phosphate aldolase